MNTVRMPAFAGLPHAAPTTRSSAPLAAPAPAARPGPAVNDTRYRRHDDAPHHAPHYAPPAAAVRLQGAVAAAVACAGIFTGVPALFWNAAA